MSYTTYRDNPVSEKIVLVELDPLEDGDLWVNVQPGIWATTYAVNKGNVTYNFGAGAFGYGAFGTAGVADLSNGNTRARINSFYDGNAWYAKAASLADLQTTDSSFYFDTATQILYVHFANHSPPDVFPDIKLGVSLGYANKGCYLDNIYYDARVLGVPAIGRSKDPLFFGKISFDGGTIQFINADGAFDTFQADHEIYGAATRILLGFEDNVYADFKTLYEGYVEGLRLTEDVFEVTVNDKRKTLSRKLPTAVFDTTTYPDLDLDDADKPIPLAYGDLKNIPVRCTNPEDGSGPWVFKICDTTYRSITAIDAVYVEGGTARTSVGWSGTSLTNATFSLTAGTYTAGKDDVFADIQGYASGASLMSNGLEIIRDLLANWYAKPYTSVFYDTAAWGSAEAAAADIALFVDEPTEGWKLIEEICYSLAGNFIVKDDGTFTFRKYDSARAVDQTIYAWELLDPLLEVDYDTEEVLSSVRVGHTKDWGEDSYTELLYNTSESVVQAKFKAYREKTFETLLTASGSAETFAEEIMAISDDVRPIFAITTKMQSVDRELSDMVNVQLSGENRSFAGWMSCEVIGKVIDLDAMTVALTLRKT